MKATIEDVGRWLCRSGVLEHPSYPTEGKGFYVSTIDLGGTHRIVIFATNGSKAFNDENAIRTAYGSTRGGILLWMRDRRMDRLGRKALSPQNDERFPSLPKNIATTLMISAFIVLGICLWALMAIAF